MKGERREHYREMRKGAADVLKALRWTPPKSRRRTLAHTAECEAQALAVRAIAGATKRCAGRRESDEEWEAMEQLLAGRLPEPSVMDQDPPEDFTQGTAADGGINNQSTGREEEGTRGGEEGTSSLGNRAPERGTEGKEGEDTRNGVGGECVYLLATEATSTT